MHDDYLNAKNERKKNIKMDDFLKNKLFKNLLINGINFF